jgi:BON domain
MPGPLMWLPIGRSAAAWWAWKNRRELGRWVGFALSAIQPSGRNGADLLTEARLRGALARDERTRGAPSFTVLVRDGIATLEGRLTPQLHDLVVEIAADTKGVERVDCSIRDRGTRRSTMNHVHVLDVPSVPPRPV